MSFMSSAMCSKPPILGMPTEEQPSASQEILLTTRG